MSELGTKKSEITLNYGVANLLSGLFGNSNKAVNVEIYDNGIVLNKKKDSDTFLFKDIKKVKTFDFFAPLSAAIPIELFDNSGAKIASFSLPPDKKDAYKLLEAHRDAMLGENFPENLHELSLNLGEIRIENGTLIEVVKKEEISYPLSDIQDFVYNKGLFYFTTKNSDDKLVVFMDHADNCLTTIEIGKYFTGRNKPKNLFL